MQETHGEAANTAERGMYGMSPCHCKKTPHTRRARGMPGAHKQVTKATSKSERGNGNVHARLVTKQAIPTHALIGRQRRTSGMEKNQDTATHTQTTLGDTAAAATQTPATTNEVHISSLIPPTPQQPTLPPFFCPKGPRLRGGGGPRERGSRQGKIPRHTQGRKASTEKCTPGRMADQRGVEERVESAATQKEEEG